MNKQIEEMRNDLIEIFDEEYDKRRLITPQFTAEKLSQKGYRKASYVAREIFEEIKKHMEVGLMNGHIETAILCIEFEKFAELEKKYKVMEDGQANTD